MKTLRSTILILSALGFDMLFFIVVILQVRDGEFDYFFTLMGLLIAIAFPFLAFTNRVQYNEEGKYLVVRTWRTKTQIDFDAITAVTGGTYFVTRFGGYGIKTYGSREFILFMPFEYRKVRRFFDAIERTNPGIEFDVWWYKKTRAEIFKTVGKWVLLVLAIFAATIIPKLLGGHRD